MWPDLQPIEAPFAKGEPFFTARRVGPRGWMIDSGCVKTHRWGSGTTGCAPAAFRTGPEVTLVISLVSGRRVFTKRPK